MTERTLAVIKPGAVRRGSLGYIVCDISNLDFPELGPTPLLIQRQEWTKAQAEHFYQEHVGKPFFKRLVAHAISGPCYAMLLEGENVVARWRAAMGPTDPLAPLEDDAYRYDLRSEFGTELPDNAVHGSADVEAALREIDLMRYWFDWRL